MTKKVGQSVLEYFVMTTLVLLVIFYSGVINRIQQTFSDYFDNAVAHME